jgi:mono/diheme cytochrome c family protein
MQTTESEQTPVSETPEPLYALVAEFPSGNELLTAASELRDDGYTRWDVYSPFPVHGIDPAIGIKPTILPWLVLGAGLSGLGLALLLQWWTNAFDYPFLISGKPIFSLPANIPVTFEVIILLSALTTFFGVMILNRMAEFYHPLFGSELFNRVTTDKFVIAIEASDPKFEESKTRNRLATLGALAIEDCRKTASSSKIPKPIWTTLIFASVVMLIPPAIVAQARSSKTATPPWRWDAGMANQPKFKPQSVSTFFTDRRAMRLPVAGTVARGDKQVDDAMFRGKANNVYIKTLPMTVTPQLMRRGQERFNIYCSACHGLGGNGDGLVAKRAEALQEGTWVMPISMNADHLKIQPDGEIFNTITNGIRTLPAYGSRIEPQDRWAIVLYVRALQRSQNSTIADVPADVAPSLIK